MVVLSPASLAALAMAEPMLLNSEPGPEVAMPTVWAWPAAVRASVRPAATANVLSFMGVPPVGCGWATFAAGPAVVKPAADLTAGLNHHDGEVANAVDVAGEAVAALTAATPEGVPEKMRSPGASVNRPER